MIIAFWLLVNGEKQKAMQAPEAARNVKIAVGPKNDTIDIISRSEIDDYLTSEFFRMYKVFERFEMGFGLPRGLSWDQQPDFIMQIIETLRAEYRKINPVGANS